MTVTVLDHVRWELVGLDDDVQFEVARALDRLELDPFPPGARLVPGSRRLYGWRGGRCRILFVRTGESIVVVSLSDRPRELPERFRRRREV